MVELKGTEKQVAWAGAIREWVKRICDEAKENGHIVQGFNEERKESFEVAEKELFSKAEASFWINNFGNVVKPRELEKLEGRKLYKELTLAAVKITEVMQREIAPILKEKGIKTGGIQLLQKYYYKKEREI